MSPGHPHVSFGSLWKSLDSGYTHAELVMRYKHRCTDEYYSSPHGPARIGENPKSRVPAQELTNYMYMHMCMYM